MTVAGGTRLLYTGAEGTSLRGDTGPGARRRSPKRARGWVPRQRTAGGPANGKSGSTGGEDRTEGGCRRGPAGHREESGAVLSDGNPLECLRPQVMGPDFHFCSRSSGCVWRVERGGGQGGPGQSLAAGLTSSEPLSLCQRQACDSLCQGDVIRRSRLSSGTLVIVGDGLENMNQGDVLSTSLKAPIGDLRGQRQG